MKVKMLKSKYSAERVVDVNDSYGARLIEQGKAVPFVAPKKPYKPEPKEAEK